MDLIDNNVRYLMFKNKLNNKLVDPKHTAVIVVDLQNDYCSSSGKVAKLKEFDMLPVQRVIPRISKFLEYARRREVLIIWTRMIEDPNQMKKNARDIILSAKDPLVVCVPGTSGFEYYKLKPKRGEIEIIKKSYGSFSNKKLDATLRKKDIKNLIIIGVYTSVCVDTTVREAHGLGYYVIVPTDLVSMPKERYHLHKAALENMKGLFAFTTNSEEIVNTWKHND